MISFIIRDHCCTDVWWQSVHVSLPIPIFFPCLLANVCMHDTSEATMPTGSQHAPCRQTGGAQAEGEVRTKSRHQANRTREKNKNKIYLLLQVLVLCVFLIWRGLMWEPALLWFVFLLSHVCIYELHSVGFWRIFEVFEFILWPLLLGWKHFTAALGFKKRNFSSFVFISGLWDVQVQSVQMGKKTTDIILIIYIAHWFIMSGCFLFKMDLGGLSRGCIWFTL